MPRLVFAQEADTNSMAEVKVTANKRGEESVLSTPMAIQAITGDQLSSQGIVQFADYARSISGLSFEDQGPGDKKFVIRGLDSTGASTTGVYFDDIVVTANNPQDGGGREPDIRLVDMERVEVLKGPQGTLYGASSMSGTVRMLTNKPDATQTYAAFNAGTGYTDGANGANYTYDGTVNLPLISDVLAVRVVGYQSEQKGWIDNNLLGQNGVNNAKVDGGRVSLRWSIGDAATLDLMYLHQATTTIGAAWFQPSFGTYVQANNSTSPWNESLDAYNVAFNWKVAAGTVTASLSKMRRDINYQYPGSRILCTLYANPRSTCYGFDNAVIEQYRSNAFQPQVRNVLSSELRYASAWSGPVQLVAGAFYDNEDANFLSTVYGLDPQMRILPTLPNIYGNRYVHNSVEQKAIFGELNYSITDALTITGGVRAFEFDIGQRSQNLPTNTRAVPAPIVLTDSTDKSATYKGNIQYKFSPNQQVYFTFAEGFRSGGNNEPDFTTGTVLPPYKSDALKSFELGGKGRYLDGLLEADLALYQMNWSNLQQRISANIPGSSVQMIANVGSARIRGAELGLQARPNRDLDLLFGLTATAMQDIITQAPPPSSSGPPVNRVGDRVPNVPKFTGNIYVQYGLPLFGWDTTARLDYSFVGDSFSDFYQKSNEQYVKVGDYSLVNLRLNFNRGAWKLGAYVDNIANRVGVITASIDTRTPVEEFATMPRTVGVTANYTFQPGK